MANDIDMYNDLETLDKRTAEYKLLMDCYFFRFMENDEDRAEKCKKKFKDKFGFWGNYY